MRYYWLFLPTAYLLWPLPALWAASRSFTPEVIDYYGFTAVRGYYHQEDDQINGTESRRTHTVLRETLSVGLMGYAYHPRFVTFFLSGTGGLEQHRQNVDGDSTSTVGSTEAYALRVKFLPQHPYNLEVFSTLEKPLIAARFSDRFQYERQTTGTTLSYKQNPWAASASYTHDRIGKTRRSEIDSIQTAMSYTSAFVAFNGYYNHLDNTGWRGTKGQTENFSVGNTIRYRWLSLASNWHYYDQESNLLNDFFLQSQRRTWQEDLDLKLPWNFDSSIDYRQIREDSTTRRPESVSKRVHDSDSVSFFLRHRLYKSLVSTFLSSYQEIDSLEGRAETRSNRLSFAYTKLIPWGSASANVWGGRSELENTGSPTFIRERQTLAAPFDRIKIESDRIKLDSIEVIVSDPAHPGLQQELDADRYSIQTGSGFTEIFILSLPAGFDVDEIERYEFFVTYELLEASFILDNREYGYGISFHLFDLLHPYFTFSSLSQELEESGALTFRIPEDRRSYLVGLKVKKTPYRAGVEYKKIESQVYPQRGWSAFIDYTRALDPKTSLFLKYLHEERTYLEHTTGLFTDPARSEQVDTALFRLERILLHNRLTTSVDGGYSEFSGSSDSTTYSLASAIRWQLGKSSLRFRADYRHTDSSFRDRESSREDIVLDFTFERKLF